MLRPALASSVGLLFCAAAFSAPAAAGMNQDLSDCTATDKTTSADACTRVMNSGRLWENQRYIGHFNRGWAYFNGGDYDKALADFDKSIELKSDYADTYFSRAIAQHMRGARDECLADLDVYLEKKGATAEAYINRARMFRIRKEPSRAFSEVQSAASVDPDNDKVEALRALVLTDLGEHGPARVAAERAVSHAPKEAGPYYARAFVAFAEGKLDDARTDVEKTISIKDKFTAAHTLLGKVLEQQSDRDAAIASFRRASEGAPKSPDAIMAQQEARERLAALTGDGALGPIAQSQAPREEPRASSDCRKFIPSAGTTVAVDCPD